jgi:2-iminobutanoate/2-iminopropanoate deaminase
MKRIISTPTAPMAIGPYSQAVENNSLLFVSGQLPINPETGKVECGSIKEQTNQVMKNLEAILLAAGYSLNNVVKTTCYITEIVNFSAMNEVYSDFFSHEPPVRTTIEVNRLPKDVLIEIDAIAMK